jgi:hypothetical protein
MTEFSSNEEFQWGADKRGDAGAEERGEFKINQQNEILSQ